MFVVKTLYFLLAFVAVVNSMPSVEHRRRFHKKRTTCSRKHLPSGSSNATLTTSILATGAPAASVTAISPDESSSTTEKSTTKTSSKTKSTSEPTSSPSSSSSSGSTSLKGNSLLAALFPVSDASNQWTTAPGADDALPLSDSTFRPTKVLKALTHSYVAAPDGKKSMKAHYPKGSYNFQHEPLGGFSFYAPGPDSLDLIKAKEATFGYSVYFPSGFDFQKGGKLPGLYGGDSEDIATGCSGGRRDVRCFSARLMFRTDGAGELYTYLPDYEVAGFEANKKVCNVAPESDCNPTYGASVGRGSFKFATGAWTTVSQRVRLNDAGQANGQLQLFVNGKSVINVSGLKITDSSAGRLRGMQMQTFFGGSTFDFASPQDQDAYFSDFSVAITESL
ncbi:polysaccharide lyase family 14 protein [Mycena floridula]|nr:polysaccharide lyase family 14 protein [Mycena floridula]